MTDTVAGYVTKTDAFYDLRFLNPFEKYGSDKLFGQRYGYVQFIFIGCTILSLVMVGIYSKQNDTLLLKLFLLLISYFLLYYNISCLLIPNNHERCWMFVWLFLISVIISTVLSIFGESLMVNMKNILTGGGSCGSHKKDDEMNGGGSCGSHKKDDEMNGGGSCGSHKKDDEMNGGDAHSEEQEAEEIEDAEDIEDIEDIEEIEDAKDIEEIEEVEKEVEKEIQKEIEKEVEKEKTKKETKKNHKNKKQNKKMGGYGVKKNKKINNTFEHEGGYFKF
jgi:hypothetical protein